MIYDITSDTFARARDYYSGSNSKKDSGSKTCHMDAN